MRLKVYVKSFYDTPVPKFISKGDWVDLCVSSGMYRNEYKKGDFAMLPLGVAMRLPKGFEANVVPRSSAFRNFGCIQVNSFGVIDNSYNGNGDEWKDPVYFIRDGIVSPGDRLCQFKIVLSQKATVWQKIKWLFCKGFEFVEVEELNGVDRGGFGSTGR